MSNGVHGAPAAEFALAFGPHDPLGVEPVDVSKAYRAAAIDLIRTHDSFGPGDIDTRFGVAQHSPVNIPAQRTALAIFPDMAADPEDPRNYRFEPTDRLIASIKSVGAEPLFRIGRSIGATAESPADLDKFARIVRYVVLHYNQGWKRGFHYAIGYWEIWNEPDFKVFWTATPQRFYELYEKSARAIKSADAGALVGGPTIAMPLNAGEFREGFLDFVRQRKVPLDFFSWHFYAVDSNDPDTFASISRQVRAVLDAHGFANTKSFLDEWNLDLFDREMSVPGRAAFAATSLIYMTGAPIDAQAIYRGDTAFRHDGAKPDAVGRVLGAFGAMKTRSPQLVSTSGGDTAGLGVLAGRSQDGHTIQILLSNYQIDAKHRGPRAAGDVLHIPNVMDIRLPPLRAITYATNPHYDLIVKLPSSGRYRVQRYRITETDAVTAGDPMIQQGPTIRLQSDFPAPSVEFIVLSAL